MYPCVMREKNDSQTISSIATVKVVSSLDAIMPDSDTVLSCGQTSSATATGARACQKKTARVLSSLHTVSVYIFGRTHGVLDQRIASILAACA